MRSLEPKESPTGIQRFSNLYLGNSDPEFQKLETCLKGDFAALEGTLSRPN